MKRYWILSLIILVLLFTGCFLEGPGTLLSSSGEAALPSDQINDTARSISDSFEFETMLSVELVLTVIPYESSLEGNSTIITLHNEQGNLVYTGKIQSDGSFRTLLQLPAAPEDMTLTLHADGFEDREVIIEDMVNYSVIERTMSILSYPLNSRSIILTDSDGDSIPDLYDAFPNDPDRAFSNSIPAEGSLTIAYEDLFLRAQAGDADYNDFIAHYTITEISNSSNQIVELQGSVEAVAKMAGYNHLFGIMIDSITGGALLSVEYIDFSGNPGRSKINIIDHADIVLFESTKNAVGKTAGFSILFNTPQDRAVFDQAPYNPYLLVYNTGHDIHLIGEDAIPGSINSGDNFQDAEGFPWALLVPINWKHPEESQRIEVHYPRFSLWRESFGTEHSDWYLHYDDPYEPDEIPNQIIGPVSPIVFKSTANPQQPVMIDLMVEGEIDLNSPVMFMYSVFSNSANIPLIEPLFIFDEINGTITVTYDFDYAGQVFELDFWTEIGGFQSIPHRILFYFEST